MGITVMTGLFDEENPSAIEESKLVGAVRETGKYYRHPDSATITYPLVVANPIGSIQSDKEKIKIAIIGGGVAGIASCYELSRLENSAKLDVTLYESDPDHFTSAVITPIALDTYGKKAGRVFAAQSYSGTVRGREKHTVYEIGAMRFPEIAGLTWHYAGVVYGDNAEVTAFPNPGKVPTELVFGSRVDRYYLKGEGLWLDINSPTRRVGKLVRAGIFGGDKDPKYPRSYFLIGDEPKKQPSEIAAELKNPNTKPERLKQIQDDWKAFAKKYDNLTLESAVRQVIRGEFEKHTALLPDIAGLCDVEDKIDYYAELFGCFGFGTGGFKPIHNTSLVEMLRLLLWDYSNEYILPEGVDENVDFIKKLYYKATEDLKLKVQPKRARVCDVCHSGSTGKALVFSYDVNPEGQESTGPPKDCEFDYVILAVTPKQMNSMISRAGFSYEARNVRFGDYGRQSLNCTLARPPLILSKKFDAPNSLLFSAINQVHMVSSSKIFVTLKEKDFIKYSPEFMKKDQRIRSVVSDCGLASSYFVPSPYLEKQQKASKDSEKYYSLLLSYTWEEDTKRMQHHLYEYPINRTAESAANKQMIEAAINRTIRVVKDPETNECKPWWFGELLSKSELSDALSYDWTTGYSAGGFKLDTTGCNYNSSLCFRYHTHALDWSSLENRFFIAGDSYSHLGGWVEGAFISAVNAVTGLLVAVNNGKIDALSEEAKKVINSLDRVHFS